MDTPLSVRMHRYRSRYRYRILILIPDFYLSRKEKDLFFKDRYLKYCIIKDGPVTFLQRRIC